MSTRTALARSLESILAAACLTMAFAGLAGLIPIAIESHLVSRLANAAAFWGVGWMTLHLRQAAHVLEPAFGAACAVLVFGALQIVLIPELRDVGDLEIPWVSVLASTACAFSLAWLGALLASGGRHRMPAGTRVVRRRPTDAASNRGACAQR